MLGHGAIKNRTDRPTAATPASLIPLHHEFPYCGTTFFCYMALRLKDPEVFSQFYRSHFEIRHLEKITICLYNYNGKHIFMMKFYSKSLLLSLVKK